MPGLAKAMRRRRAKKYPSKLDAIFDWHTPGGAAFITHKETGQPGLQFALCCSLDRYEAYRDAVSGATEARLRAADVILAFDLFDDDGPVGRLTANPVLPMLFAALDAGEHQMCTIVLCHASGDGDDLVVELPISVERVSLPDLHGDPVEVGTGPCCVVTMSQHDATLYVHRFASREEAEAQLARNKEANEPFVGAVLD